MGRRWWRRRRWRRREGSGRVKEDFVEDRKKLVFGLLLSSEEVFLVICFHKGKIEDVFYFYLCFLRPSEGEYPAWARG